MVGHRPSLPHYYRLIHRLQRLPKQLRFVMDVSSSMGRFNGSDRRLDRMAACSIMIMEAFKGLEHKYNYSIVGHRCACRAPSIWSACSRLFAAC